MKLRDTQGAGHLRIPQDALRLRDQKPNQEQAVSRHRQRRNARDGGRETALGRSPSPALLYLLRGRKESATQPLTSLYHTRKEPSLLLVGPEIGLAPRLSYRAKRALAGGGEKLSHRLTWFSILLSVKRAINQTDKDPQAYISLACFGPRTLLAQHR